MVVQVRDNNIFEDLVDAAVNAVQQGQYFRDHEGNVVVFCDGYNVEFEYWEFEELMPE